jgi:serine/threonine-protein kinase
MPAETRSPPAETLIAGRFAPRDVLGQGAFGTVLEAMDLRLQRLVALKLVRTGPGGLDPAWIAHEARAAARLCHPHVVAVHDAGDGADFAWIAMDLVIGEPLSAVMVREGALAEAEVLRLGRELLAALGHAHRRGVLHRDVKPANILLALDETPGLGTLRLGDFGVAHLARGTVPGLEGGVIGTPAWMSPEQTRGEALDGRADLWGAAVVLYEALTGARPFAGFGERLAARIQAGEFLPPSRRRPGLDACWDGFFDRALAPDPMCRFPDAALMAEALPGPAVPPREAGGLLRRLVAFARAA